MAGEHTSAAQGRDATEAEHRVPSDYLILSDYRKTSVGKKQGTVFEVDAGESSTLSEL
jgi:hypothetical protein